MSMINMPLQVRFAFVFTLLVSSGARAEELNTDSFVIATVLKAKGHRAIRSETIFVGTKIYDRVSVQDVVTKFDLNRRMVHIVNLERKAQTAVSFRELERFQNEAQASVLSDSRSKSLDLFMAKPVFNYRFDPTKRVIRLDSPKMSYEAHIQQAPADVVDRFTEFADYSKQLSTYLDRGHLAIPRMQLNKRLKENSFLPNKVSLQISKAKLSSEHRYQYSLDEKHESFIRDVEIQLKTFPESSFSAFLSRR